MEFVSQGGVGRDHAVVMDSKAQDRLAQAARKKMIYRSLEQKFTDKRQATGYTSMGPVAFGTFEVGRSSLPSNGEDDGRAVFASQMKRGLIYHTPDTQTITAIGDPGMYDPYLHTDLSAKASFTHNRGNLAFNSTEARELKHDIYGQDCPGPGYYGTGEAFKAVLPFVDNNRSVFASVTSQRETFKTSVPPPDAYTPNMASVYPNVRNGGASMRGHYRRMIPMSHPSHLGGEQSQTEETIGPGAYEEHQYNTIPHLLKQYSRRKSKLNPGFGTISPARQLPYGQKDDSPGPGAYQPVVWAGRYAGKPRTEQLEARVHKHLRAGGPPSKPDANAVTLGDVTTDAQAPIELEAPPPVAASSPSPIKQDV